MPNKVIPQGNNRRRRVSFALLAAGAAVALLFTNCEDLGKLDSSNGENRSSDSSVLPTDTLTLSRTQIDALPGASWDLSVLPTNGTPPYTLELLQGPGTVGVDAQFTAAAGGPARVRITDAEGRFATLTVHPVLPSLEIDFRQKSLVGRIDGALKAGLITHSRNDGGQEAATFFNEDGRLQRAAPGSPRFDHDPARCADPNLTVATLPACKRFPLGLLMERPSTNLIPNSEDFLLWTAGAATQVTANATQAPDGNTTAARFVTPAATGTFLTVDVPATVGTTYTFSLWARANNDPDLALILFNTNAAPLEINLTPEWRRYVVTGVASQATIQVQIQNDKGGANLTADAFIWGAQLEVGSGASSYIPTAGAPRTRGAEVAFVADLSWWNPTAGTWVVEWARGGLDASGAPEIFRLHNGSPAEGHVLGRESGAQTTRYTLQAGAAVHDIAGVATWTGAFTRKTVTAFGGGFLSLREGGAAPNDVAINDLPQGLLRLDLGHSSLAVDRHLNGTLRVLRFYPKRLEPFELSYLAQ